MERGDLLIFGASARMFVMGTSRIFDPGLAPRSQTLSVLDCVVPAKSRACVGGSFRCGHSSDAAEIESGVRKLVGGVPAPVPAGICERGRRAPVNFAFDDRATFAGVFIGPLEL